LKKKRSALPDRTADSETEIHLLKAANKQLKTKVTILQMENKNLTLQLRGALEANVGLQDQIEASISKPGKVFGGR